MSLRKGSLSFFFFAALFLCACSSPYKVVRQAKPNPFSKANSQFKLQQVVFTNLEIGGDPASLDKKKFEGDKSFLAQRFRRALLGGVKGGIRIYTGKAAPNIFVIRPHVYHITPGGGKTASLVKIRLQILKNNKILDELMIEAGSKVGKGSAATVSGRMQRDGKKIGEIAAKYIVKRVGK